MINDRDIHNINSVMESVSPYTEKPIVYQVYRDTTPGNKAAGVSAVRNYDPDPDVTGAMFRNLTLEEVEKSGGAYVRGDAEFKIRRETKPSYDDRIDYDGDRWEPKDISPPPLNGVKLWTVIASKE